MNSATADQTALTAPEEVQPDRAAASAPVRLSVNLAPDVAEALRHWSTSKGLSITEGIRRAIAVWNFMETEREKGNTLAAIEPSVNGSPERIREIVLV